jgi:nitrogen fixation NifU-like protein
MYSDKVMKHFKNPHNQGVIKNADAVGEAGNPRCGDMMKMYLKISKKQETRNKKQDFIKDIKFETLGCAAAIAVSSAMTDMVKGKTLEEAKKLTKDKIVDNLEGLPPAKIHCSMLGLEALHAAIKDYELKNNKISNN